ncbi:MAG: 4'-phosphopantetheinyl transferase superfamily protein [Firmicutes bacterium]|nr:4'-phosphopantetheinyl transferase superfamily protein [Bacillota bacterium]
MQVWAVQLDGWDDTWWDEGLSLIPEADAARVLRCANVLARRQKLIAQILARWSLATLTGGTVREIALVRDARGKLHAPTLPWHFNVSHSGDYVVVATGREPLGIDIEKRGPVSDGLLHDALTAGEYAYVTACHDEETRNARFFDVWVRKESYFKALGTGLTGPWRSISFVHNRQLCQTYGTYYFYDCALDPGYVTVLCSGIPSAPLVRSMRLTTWISSLCRG